MTRITRMTVPTSVVRWTLAIGVFALVALLAWMAGPTWAMLESAP